MRMVDGEGAERFEPEFSQGADEGGGALMLQAGYSQDNNNRLVKCTTIVLCESGHRDRGYKRKKTL